MGVYNEDDCEGIHPNAIQEYYGTTRGRVHRGTGQTGAGHPPEEHDDDYADNHTDIDTDNGHNSDCDMETGLVDKVVQAQDSDIRHDSIPTADHEAPLMSPKHLVLFSNCLTALRNDQGDLLHSMADHPLVWDPVEMIRVGHRRQKELVISLEDVAWEKRALVWLAALRLLDSLQ